MTFLTEAEEAALRERKFLEFPGARLINIRVLPQLKTIAKDLGDFFGPDDAAMGETIVRYGRIEARDGRIAECVFAYEKSNGLGQRAVVRYPGEDWELSSGYGTPTPAQAAAVVAVIGRIV